MTDLSFIKVKTLKNIIISDIYVAKNFVECTHLPTNLVEMLYSIKNKKIKNRNKPKFPVARVTFTKLIHLRCSYTLHVL